VLKMLAGYAIDEQDDLPSSSRSGRAGWSVRQEKGAYPCYERDRAVIIRINSSLGRSCSVKHRSAPGAVLKAM